MEHSVNVEDERLWQSVVYYWQNFLKKLKFKNFRNKRGSKIIFSYEKTTVLKTFGLWPYEPSVAVAVAKGAKPSAMAVEIRTLVDLWSLVRIWT